MTTKMQWFLRISQIALDKYKLVCDLEKGRLCLRRYSNYNSYVDSGRPA